MNLALITAMTRDRVIGRDNGLPWRLPKDMRHFMRATLGKPVIMGRRTLESMPGPLPRRTNIVLTRQPGYAAAGIEVAADFAAALDIAERQCRRDGADTAFVIGGAPVYTAGLPLADRLHITWVEGKVEGDTWFPEVDWRQWRETASRSHPADADHAHAFRIATYDRIESSSL
ncbi:MAG: dihydrofolate reductase [Gammaproteobacteria bacterium]|nr:dihydrofolate reductase [Gammaproteobacteria bacterium]